jgi:tryptophan halogenase
MIPPAQVKRVIVAGGGIVGWSAAAALKRRLPLLEVSVLPIEPSADSLADLMGGTLPSIIGFHDDLGLGDGDTIRRAQSGVRTGTLFEGWSTRPSNYVHSYGPVGQRIGPSSFHQVWLRSRQTAHPFDHYSLAAQAARQERIVVGPPNGLFGSGSDAGHHGLHLAVPLYKDLMRAFALHLGARLVEGQFAEVRLREDGFIRALALTSGREVTADVFVDATGPRARLRSAMDGRFEGWGQWLLADRVVIQNVADQRASESVLDINRAHDAGWSWRFAAPGAVGSGLIASSAHAADWEQDFQSVGAPEAIRIRQGRRPEPWLRNCVAIGDAAVAVEPLEWTNLHLAHSAIDRPVSMMPGKDCAPVELAEYNRQCGLEADRVRDFLCLHYVAGPSSRSAFWRDAGSIDPPPSLAHTLALFRERGRLPFHEEETFDRDSWFTVLLGQGFVPQRIDPLTDVVTDDEAESAMASVADRIARRIPTLPTPAAFRRSFESQVA